MTYPIFQWSEPVGELELTQDGLYWSVCARVPDEGMMVHICLVGEEQTVVLPASVPEAGLLVCRTRLSHRVLPQRLRGALVLRRDWEDWHRSGDGWRRMNEHQVELAQPHQADEPVEQVEHYPDLHTETIEGQLCLVRTLRLSEYLYQTTQPAQTTEEPSVSEQEPAPDGELC